MKNRVVRMIREHMEDIPEIPFPKGFGVRYYRPGEGHIWTRIQRAAEPFLDIDDRLFEREFGDNLREMNDRCFFVVTDKGEEVGTITAWWHPNWRGKEWGQLHWLAIHPAYQRRGLAKAVTAVALKRLKQSHARCFLDASTGRIAAIKIHLDFGFYPYLESENSRRAWEEVASVLEHPTLKEKQKWAIPMKLSVCIISLNNERGILRCLNSVLPFADEVVIVDGGSKDDTIDIVKSIKDEKIRLFHHPWPDDFSVQRNLSLHYARGDWIFVIDADETIGRNFAKFVGKLMKSRRYVYYWFRRYWLVSVNPMLYLHGEPIYPDYQLRLFRNKIGAHYRGKVHVSPRIYGLGAYAENIHLFHYKLIDETREEREEDIKRYENLERDAGLMHRKYYLGESYDYARRKVKEQPL